MSGAAGGPDTELTTSQAAGLLGVSVATLGRYVRDGLIEVARTIGRSNLYRRTEVEALHRKLHPHESQPQDNGRHA